MRKEIRKEISTNRTLGEYDIIDAESPSKEISKPIDRCPFEIKCYYCFYLFPELISKPDMPLIGPDKCPCNIIGHDKVQEFVNNYLGE